MIAIADIIAAAIVGVAVATLFEGKWGPLLVATPALGLLHCALLLIPASVFEAAAPSSLLAVAGRLADPMLMVATMVACATGSLLAAMMLQQSRAARGDAFWLPDMDRPARAEPGPPRQPDLASRLDREVHSKTRRLIEQGYAAGDPVPAFEVAPAAPQFGPRAPQAAQATQVAPGESKRRSPRRRTLLSGRICADGGISVPCVIRNLSTNGAALRLESSVVLPKVISLIEISSGVGHQAQVRWRLRDSVGVRFLDSFDLSAPEGPDAAALALQWAALRT